MIAHRRPRLALAILLACNLLASTSLAQTRPPTPAARTAPTPAPTPPTPLTPLTAPPVTAVAAPPTLEETLHGPAKDAYDSARLLLANNDFAGALTKFQQAYDLSKDPRLLYNMAICSKNVRGYARMQRLLEQYERDAGASMTSDERSAVDTALAAIKGLVGALELTVSPNGATILVDGATVGTSPLKDPLFVDLGAHTLSVRLPGFDSVEKPIGVEGGNVTELSITLTATAHVANLIVSADEAATVLIDGRVAGNGRYHDKIASGQHTVRVTESGKVAFQSEVDLRDGETRTLEVTLQEEKHGGALWPWIVGGAAVLAGGVIGSYFIFKPSDTTTAPPLGKLGGVQLASFLRWNP